MNHTVMRLDPANIDELDADTKEILAKGDEIMGFSSNDALLMAHKPAMLKATLGLVQSVYQEGCVPLVLKKLVALMTSSAAGCQYCQVHTQYGAINEGVEANKISEIWNYSSSDLFSDAERAALDVARTAAFSPNETSDRSFDRLKEFYSPEQIVELVGVIALFGFLNRWNSTFNTTLEQTPKAVVQASGLKK